MQSFNMVVLLLWLIFCINKYILLPVDGAACPQITDENSCNLNPSCEWNSNISPNCYCASSAPLDILFILDSSGSVNYNNQNGWAKEKNFVNKMITEAVSESSNVAVTKFSDIQQNIYLWSQQQQPRSVITSAVSSSSLRGSTTNMYAALADAYYKFRDSSPSNGDNARLLVFMTDGVPVPSNYGACYTLNFYPYLVGYLKIKIIVIGIGNGWDPQDVDCLVDDPDSQIIHVDSFSNSDFDKVRAQTDDFLCPDSFSLKLTEMRTGEWDDNGGNTYEAQFVEFYNPGDSFTLDSITRLKFSGFMTSNLFGGDNCNLELPGYEYIVFYNPDNSLDPLECYNCDCTTSGGTSSGGLCSNALYIPCNGNTATSGNCGTCTWDASSVCFRFLCCT